MIPRTLVWKRFAATAATAVAAISLQLPIQAASITVQADRPAHRISPTLWGIFFEDINLSADGGIYAELVRNRSFEDSDKPEHWTLLKRGGEASMTVSQVNPMAADPTRTRNRRSLQLDIAKAGADSPVALANDGYWGMAVKQGEQYDLTFFARAAAGFNGPLIATLESADGKVLAREQVAGIGAGWKQFRATFKLTATDPKARLVLSAAQPGTVWLDFVSLFPRATWKGHGLRPDLAEMLVGLKPAFVRFPGGCWVEGDTMREAYRWKETLGDPTERRLQWNIWQYWATHGLGYHEYLQMCEDLGAEPLFVINCGMSHKENIPMDQMGPFVQDALDAIEYANGPTNSVWGGLRARTGHPAPFNLKYLEIGNENGGPAYHERWTLFHKAIRARYPEVQLIANVWGGYPTKERPDIIDEHYYDTPDFFIRQAGKYDNYDRKGPKVYVGEYAVTRDTGLGNLRGAVGEAAFMVGMERNSDVVTLSSYAPLFCNANHKRWPVNLINYDSSRAYGIPSFYVQQMFAANRGDVVLPVEVAADTVTESIKGGVGVGTWLTQAEFKDMKVTRGNKTLFAADFAKGTDGWKMLGGGEWKVQDGALRQNGSKENIRATAGNKDWDDYTYSLKARKLGGAEGFLILFGVRDDNQKAWWNIGGWGNSRHAIEMGGILGNEVPGKIETGRWYDIRVEVKGQHIQCYLDGKLVHDITTPPVKSLVATASRDEASGELILKVVNVTSTAQQTDLQFNGVKRVTGPARALVLASEKPTDENTLDQPKRVAPVEKTLAIKGTKLRHNFPGNSVTVLRMKAE